MALQIGIVGQSGSDPRFSPQRYLGEPLAQQLIVRLCDGPLPVTSVDTTLLDNLLRVEAVRIAGGQCYLNFTCFLRTDIAILNKHGAAFGHSLAEAVRQAFRRSDLLSLSNQHRTDLLPQYLFFLVGCVVLDWHALSLLDRMGYTLSSTETVRPSGGNYTIFGNELFERSLRGLYWGSHNEQIGNYTFTSFGDHDSQRQCLPDVLWRIQRAARSTEDGTVDGQVSDVALGWYALQLAQHITGERPGDDRVKSHLAALRYTSDDHIAIPVLVPNDRDTVLPFVRRMDQAVADWARQNNEDMQQAFRSLAPLRQGVAWREVLIQVWHYVFAHANSDLCSDHTLFDPYSAASAFRGYLPVVFHSDCGLWDVTTGW